MTDESTAVLADAARAYQFALEDAEKCQQAEKIAQNDLTKKQDAHSGAVLRLTHAKNRLVDAAKKITNDR